MDLLTKFYNIKRRDMSWSFRKRVLGHIREDHIKQ